MATTPSQSSLVTDEQAYTVECNYCSAKPVAEVMTNLDVTLNSCTTVKKLREVWVNGAAIIDKALGQSQQSPTVHMPMVAIQTLDALVPLP